MPEEQLPQELDLSAFDNHVKPQHTGIDLSAFDSVVKKKVDGNVSSNGTSNGSQSKSQSIFDSGTNLASGNIFKQIGNEIPQPLQDRHDELHSAIKRVNTPAKTPLQKFDQMATPVLQFQNDVVRSMNPNKVAELSHDANGHWGNIVQNVAANLEKAGTKIVSGTANLARDAADYLQNPAKVFMPSTGNLYDTNGELSQEGKEATIEKDPLGKLIIGLNGNTKRMNAVLANNQLPNTFLGNTVNAISEIAPDIAAATLAPETKVAEGASLLSKAGGLLFNKFTNYLIGKGIVTGYGEAKDQGESQGQALGQAIKGGAQGAKTGIELAILGAGSGLATKGIMAKAAEKGLIGAKGVATRQLVNLGTDLVAYSLIQPTINAAEEGRFPTMKEIADGAGIAAAFRIKGGAEELSKHSTLNKAIQETQNQRQGAAIANFVDADHEAIKQVYDSPETAQELNLKALEAAKKAKEETDLSKKQAYVAQAITFTKASNVKSVADMVLNNPQGLEDFKNSPDIPDKVKQEFLQKAQEVSDLLKPQAEDLQSTTVIKPEENVPAETATIAENEPITKSEEPTPSIVKSEGTKRKFFDEDEMEAHEKRLQKELDDYQDDVLKKYTDNIDNPSSEAFMKMNNEINDTEKHKAYWDLIEERDKLSYHNEQVLHDIANDALSGIKGISEKIKNSLIKYYFKINPKNDLIKHLSTTKDNYNSLADKIGKNGLPKLAEEITRQRLEEEGLDYEGIFSSNSGWSKIKQESFLKENAEIAKHIQDRLLESIANAYSENESTINKERPQKQISNETTQDKVQQSTEAKEPTVTEVSETSEAAKEEENNKSKIKGGQNALQEPSASSVLQHSQESVGESGSGRRRMEQGEQVEETTETLKENGGSNPPSTPSNEGANENEIGGGTGITHADTEELRKEKGLGDYERNPETAEKWDAEARDRIKKGEMPKLIKKLESGDGDISKVEQRMLGQEIANLNEEVSKNPTDANLNALKRLVRLSDIAGSEWGKLGVARKGSFLPDESLGAHLIKEMESMGVNELTEAEKQKAIDEYKEIAEVKDKLAKAEQEIQRLQNEAIAKEEVEKINSASKKNKTKKTHEDFVEERKSLKDELKAAKEKHLKWLSDNGIQQAGVGGNFVLTADMAKVIAKMAKSYAEEAVLKFDDLVNKVYEDAKDVLDGIKKSDIINVLAGAYNEKRETLSEKKAQIVDYKKEAQLLKKLQEARLNKPNESVKSRRDKSRRILDLENKIKEIRNRRKDDTPVEKTDGERIADKRKYIERKIAEIKSDIKNGKFEKEPRKPPVILDKKTQALQDRLIELEAQQAIRRAKNDYEKMSKLNKAADTFWQIAGLRRLVSAAVDFSIMFRQARDITLNPFKYARIENGRITKGTALKAWQNMFNLSFDVKGFKRFQYELEKSELGRQFVHFGGVFSNPTEVKMEKREEEFANSLLSRIHQNIESGDNEKLKKAAHIADTIWFSERAAAAALNTIRIEEFTRGAKDLLRRGMTMENSPEEYKDLVKWTMNITGRGNMIKVLEDSHAGRIIANRTYFGARLMAAKINMLNPATYIKMSPEVRNRAIMDMAGSTAGFLVLAAAGVAAGGKVSLDWDDPDFLQLRFGDKVYDLSGGSVGYVRTFLRFTNAMLKQAKHYNSKEANSYSTFAGKSLLKTMVTNKLSPNTGYLYHWWTGKGGGYDANGKPEKFDKYELAKVYPLWVDGTVNAYKKGGLSEAVTIAVPDIFGIGTQQYEEKHKKGKTGGAGAGGGYKPL